MGLFGRKEKVIDLGERYQRVTPLKKVDEEKPADATATGFNFLGGLAGAGSTNSSNEEQEFSGTADEKKRKLAKRLMDMNDKIEDLNNQIYHLQQRIEVLERKAGVGSYE